ncbi:helix-turn-helix domain-containing protein [Mycobacterium sp.]|uniref:helix-turn-helix domain-containing protein n=1 Tax=Mycobacterium sp. TaxID=1785 RepID=UPI0025F3E03D|nr:helix-turn-helix domain-containing protein [Mycobacterium sp.]
MPSDTDTHDPDDLVTSAEAARLGRVSKITIHRAVKAGKLTPLRTPGGHFRFRRSDIEALLTEQASA